jgi:hypothetical protein
LNGNSHPATGIGNGTPYNKGTCRKKLIKSDNPLIHQGNAPPAAKKDFMLLPDFAKTFHMIKTSAEKTTTTQTSILPMCNVNLMLNFQYKSTDYFFFLQLLTVNIFRKRYRKRYLFSGNVSGNKKLLFLSSPGMNLP